MLPERDQFVSLGRAIVSLEQEGYTEDCRLCVLRRLAASLSGTESFLRAAVGIEVFTERGLLSVEREEDMLSLRSIPGRRADLEESVYVIKLRKTIAQHLKGGR